MSPRAIRRAAEHEARKLAYRESKNPGLTEAPFGITPLAATAREGAAVRPSDFSPTAKPHSSTGPRTPEGKAISSMNALRTGLTGRTVLLSTDDADVYAAHIENYRAEYQPVGLRETELVQSLADTAWRLGRIPGLEMGIYALGRREFADNFGDHDDPALRAATVELHTFLKYEKQLRNLQLQESRLRRRYTAETKELRELQAARRSAMENSAPTSDQLKRPNNKPVTSCDTDHASRTSSNFHLASQAAAASVPLASLNLEEAA